MAHTERQIPIDPRSTVLGPKSPRIPPYNTGKVLIGCRYEPPKPNYVVSEDAYRLQTALLMGRRK
jgi:hypothetical protein